MNKEAFEKYKQWLKYVDDLELKKELEEMQGNEERIEECFYKNLNFGTAGIRGVIGAGSNMMNIYTVMSFTHGVCSYLENKNKSVVICYDNRKCSKLFAQISATYFIKNGIKVFLSKTIMPSPFLSFAVRSYNAGAGIMITASHNPPQYNGYKVYDKNGCQLLDDDTSLLQKSINDFSIKDAIDFDYNSYLTKVQYIDEELRELYIKKIIEQILTKDYKNKVKNIKIVYTALNGTGCKIMPLLFESMGIENVYYQKEQCLEDENFATCKYPNPENEEALAKAIAYAKEKEADLVIATDPDADRMGIAILHKGEYVLPNGNEIGILLMQHILDELSRNSLINGNQVVVKSFVSNRIINKMCKKYNIKIKEVLTGFKYIGKYISDIEGSMLKFIFGMEESYGYLRGDYIRDKDAFVASALICVYCAILKEKKLSLIDELKNIYNEYGEEKNVTRSYKFEGISGENKIKQIMNALRGQENFLEIGGKKVVEKIDYQTDNTILQKANVVVFNCEDNVRVIVRPSGTEPVIKVYYSFYETRPKTKGRLVSIHTVSSIFERLERDIKKLFEI